MNNQYTIILELSAYHSYFNDGKMGILNFKPTVKTQQLIVRHGLLVRKNKNRFSLIHSKKEKTIDVLGYIIKSSDIDYLEFNVFTDDAYFYNYTDIPLDWIGQFDYSNNSKENKQDSDSTILNPNPSVNTSTSKLGTIKFYLEDLISQAANDAAKFEIRFEARKTQWNYYIIAQNPTTGLSIEGKSNLQFEGPNEVELINGIKAMKFSTGSTLISLQEKSKLKFDLIKRFDLKEGEIAPDLILSGLPVADPNKLEMVKIGGSQVASSDMFIYI